MSPTPDPINFDSAREAVLVPSDAPPEDAREVKGVDFEQYRGRDITVAELVDNMEFMGFQGSAVAEATRIVNEMVRDDTSSCIVFFFFQEMIIG